MLKSLVIKNYTLIDHLVMEPASGFTTITGETGAGKSIMLGAVGLMLGQRADTKTLLNEEEKCIIEGTFDLSRLSLKAFFDANDLDYENETIIRREILPSGKSRAFVNDTPVLLDALKNLGSRLIDVHSQHDHLLLGNSTFQLEVIDAFGQIDNERSSYQEKYRTYQKTGKELEDLQQQAGQLNQEVDYDRFIFEELTKAGLEDEQEQEVLEEELQRLENAEEIKIHLTEAQQVSSEAEINIQDLLRHVTNELNKVRQYGSSLADLAKRAEENWLEIKDLAAEIGRENDNIMLDEPRLSEVKDRLSLFYQLETKHNCGTLRELIQLREKLDEKLSSYDSLDDTLAEKKAAWEKAKEEVLATGQELRKKRLKSIPELSSKLSELLSPLGMPDAQIEMQHTETTPSPTGLDSFEILFSANKGHRPVPLRQAASGGEISRVMFAVKYILTGRKALPSIIFDEIDTGVSGEIAIKMAEMMNKMAHNHQVISITHLPQIAARGIKHYFVYKDTREAKTISQIRLVEEEQRVKAIAEMIGGSSPSENAYSSAREMLQQPR